MNVFVYVFGILLCLCFGYIAILSVTYPGMYTRDRKRAPAKAIYTLIALPSETCPNITNLRARDRLKSNMCKQKFLHPCVKLI